MDGWREGGVNVEWLEREGRGVVMDRWLDGWIKGGKKERKDGMVDRWINR